MSSVSIFKVKHSLNSWASVLSSSAVSSCDTSTQAKSKSQVLKVNPVQPECKWTKAPTIRKKEGNNVKDSTSGRIRLSETSLDCSGIRDLDRWKQARLLSGSFIERKVLNHPDRKMCGRSWSRFSGVWGIMWLQADGAGWDLTCADLHSGLCPTAQMDADLAL